MKAKYVATAAVAAAALALSACGGKASFQLSGTVLSAAGTPIANSGLILANGNDTVAVGLGQSTFTFPGSISYGTEYNVTVKQQPEHMTCTVFNPHGAAGQTTSISVSVQCSQNTYVLGGTVNNLKLDGLVIFNGSGATQLPIAKSATTFEYGRIPVGSPYGLSIFSQPKDEKAGTSQTCTIVNSTGVMGDADRKDVVINCQ